MSLNEFIIGGVLYEGLIGFIVTSLRSTQLGIKIASGKVRKLKVADEKRVL